MKRNVIRSFLALALCLLLTIPAFAAGTVTYTGGADAFLFAPGAEESPTALFERFRDVMPGDTLTEQIVIRNDSAKGVKIKVYLRSLGAQEGTEDFLSLLKLTVRQQEDTVLFDAAADETAQLTDWVLLGTVYSGGTVTLDVTLEVPIELGNDFQDQSGLLDWQFKVEELPVEPSDPKPPQTGDQSRIGLYIGIMAVSIAAVAVLLIAGKRRR